jgi:hypothetical protein
VCKINAQYVGVYYQNGAAVALVCTHKTIYCAITIVERGLLAPCAAYTTRCDKFNHTKQSVSCSRARGLKSYRVNLAINPLETSSVRRQRTRNHRVRQMIIFSLLWEE